MAGQQRALLQARAFCSGCRPSLATRFSSSAHSTVLAAVSKLDGLVVFSYKNTVASTWSRCKRRGHDFLCGVSGVREIVSAVQFPVSAMQRSSGAALQITSMAFDVANSSNVMFLISCSLLPCRRSCWGTRTRTSCSACSAWFLFRIAAHSLRARKKTRDSHVFCCMPWCPHAVVHMMLSTCSPVGASASFQPASQPACAFSQSASSILARRCASSVQFSSVQLSVIGYRLLVIGYQLSVRMLLSACHSIWTPCF